MGIGPVYASKKALERAGLPYQLGGETVNRLCASGMAATMNAARAIKDGAGDIYIAGGVEHMTRGPWVISKTSSAYGRDAQMYDSSFGWRFINPKMEELYGVDSMGGTAENLAEMYKIDRASQDKFSAWSQEKAAKAIQSGRFAEEIIPVSIPQKKKDPIVFQQDEFARPENLKPLAKIISGAIAGVEPRIMGIGPVYASKKALERAGLTLDQMDILELNEAFAAQVLACTRELGLEDNDPRINPNGGAIALGHPLGMSGARILLSAAIELQKTNKRYALVTMCIGLGQGYAVVIERA